MQHYTMRFLIFLFSSITWASVFSFRWRNRFPCLRIYLRCCRSFGIHLLEIRYPVIKRNHIQLPVPLYVLRILNRISKCIHRHHVHVSLRILYIFSIINRRMLPHICSRIFYCSLSEIKERQFIYRNSIIQVHLMIILRCFP